MEENRVEKEKHPVNQKEKHVLYPVSFYRDRALIFFVFLLVGLENDKVLVSAGCH